MTKFRDIKCVEAEKLLPLNRENNVIFQAEGWRGFVFDRDRHGASRLPKWFFEWLISSSAEETVFVCGVGEIFLEMNPQGLVSLPFQWETYKAFMRKTYSAEFVLFSPRMWWVIRADPDLTVWGCSCKMFTKFVDFMGGDANAYRIQCDEFDMQIDEKSEFSVFLDSVFYGSRIS